MKPITIVLADDHQVVRQGVRALLEREPGFSVIGEAGDGRAAVRLVTQHEPDVLVVDFMMPELDGVGLLQQVQQSSPQTRVVMLSVHQHSAYVHAAMSK